MTRNADIARVQTGVRNLDALLHGGLPQGSVTVVGGPPGSGKTTLAQQLCFREASVERLALFFSTLSEPTAKTLRYLKQFSFFDAAKVETSVRFIDLGILLRADGLEEASKLVMAEVKKLKPAIVVIDSYKAFDDLARSKRELRKFGYEIAVNLMAWETTSLLIGEYGPADIASNPLFSITDGLILATQREESGEHQRFIQIVKMRGTSHNRDEHPFVITDQGLEVFAPRVTIRRQDHGPGGPRCKTGITKLDELLGEGISRGSTVLVGGVAGTGKTVLLLEFIYRGALAGEKGIVFSFEETEERLCAAAKGLGWKLGEEIARGMVEIVFIAQPDILVEAHLLMMRDRIEAMGAKRVAVDSVSVFLHKVSEPGIAREKTFQLASMIQNSQAVGLFATDIPYGATKISRFGVEETVVDGIILLTSSENGLDRQRYIEVYKLRNTAHLKGRHNMLIGAGGITIFPRYEADVEDGPLLSPDRSRRVSFGVPGVDGLMGGGLLEGSVTFLTGPTGVGKSTMALQFIADGAARGEPGVYVSLEERPRQIMRTADAMELPFGAAIAKGLVEIVHLSREQVRENQLPAILTERVQALGARRVAVDGIHRVSTDASGFEDVRGPLTNLVDRLKKLGATSLFTLEATSPYLVDAPTCRGLSPVADNIVVLRYAEVPGGLRPTLTIIKTRASAHDWDSYHLAFGKGGVRLSERLDQATTGPEAELPPPDPVKSGRP